MNKHLQAEVQAEQRATGCPCSISVRKQYSVSLPQGPIPRGASDVHGLTRTKLRSMGARPWSDVHPELAELLRGAGAVLIWNAEYDRRLLDQTAERHGLTLPSAPWRCAMRAKPPGHTGCRGSRRG